MLHGFYCTQSHILRTFYTQYIHASLHGGQLGFFPRVYWACPSQGDERACGSDEHWLREGGHGRLHAQNTSYLVLYTAAVPMLRFQEASAGEARDMTRGRLDGREPREPFPRQRGWEDKTPPWAIRRRGKTTPHAFTCQACRDSKVGPRIPVKMNVGSGGRSLR